MTSKGIHLVTGGSGYLGAALACALHHRGYPVRIFDMVETDNIPAHTEFVKGDVRDFQAVSRSMKGVRVCYHCAAMVPLSKKNSDFVDINQNGTDRVLQAACENGIKKVVHLSSSAVYGIPSQNPVIETHTPLPLEPYGQSKLEAEKICQQFVAKGLDISIIRPRTILGHGRLGLMQMLFEWIRQGRTIPVFDGGHNLYQFIHVDDLTEACILAAARKGSRIYNIGAKRFGSIRHALMGLIEYAGTNATLKSVPSSVAVTALRWADRLGVSPLGPYHALMYGKSIYFDTRRAEQDLGFNPTYGNLEMLCESYEYYCHNRNSILNRSKASIHRSAISQGILGLLSQIL